MKKMRAWWQGLSELDQLRYSALIALALIALVPCIAALLAGETWSGLSLNFGTEMAGAFVTFIVFDRLIGRYEKHEEEEYKQEQLKATLIAQMGSQVNDVAIAAVEQLRWQGSLENGSLQKANLTRANLQGANLVTANLQGANLVTANLQKALLTLAVLQDVDLAWANLKGVDLHGAKLRGARLSMSSLQGVNFSMADLRGARFKGANLEAANFENSIFDDHSVLPDGNYWMTNTDITRFTDPAHLDFWRSDDPSSPAYRGDNGQCK